MRTKIPVLLALFSLPVAAETLFSYDSGVTAAAAQAGAADPASQGWTFTGLGSGYSDGYDSGDGGWRTVDGTGSGPANYSQSITALDQVKLVNSTTWSITWTVALDKDALTDGAGSVANYYLSPNNGRQNNLVTLIDLAADSLGFYLTHKVDSSNILLIENTGAAGTPKPTYSTGIDISAFPSFGTFSLTYDTTAGTAVLDYGGSNDGTLTATLTPGAPLIGGRNAVFFGAGSSGGQGSAVWNAVTVSVPDPVPGDQLTWTGATDGTWDAATSNWALNDSSPTTFTDGDDVTLDDTAATGSITVSGTQQPGSILVDNDTLPYSIGGDPLTGLAALTKEGPGTLTLTSNLGIAGGTTVTGGSVTAGDGATSGELGQGAVSLASGTTLTISRSDLLDYKATAKLRELSGEGDLVLDGGGLLFTYPGGGLGFDSADSWAGFAGDITVVNGSEWQSIRNGATGHGTGTIILGDGSSSGHLSGIEGNWTWTNPISVVGAANEIRNRAAGSDRSLKLQGAISGDGNLTLQDTAGAMTDANRGFVITNDVSMTGTLTIDVATPLRIGGVPGEVDVSGTGLDAASSGSLGTTAVVNNGTLTFSRTDAHNVGSAISGLGEVRIGMPSSAGRGDTSTQILSFTASQTYTGDTVINDSTLLVPSGITLDSLFIDVTAEGTLGGNGTLAGDVDVLGTLAPGASVGTLTSQGVVGFFDGAIWDVEISAWGTPTSDLLSADEIEFILSTGMTITVGVDSLADFSESNQTFVIATTTNGIFDFDALDFTIDDSAFSAATGSLGSWAIQQNGNNIELVYTAGSATDYDVWANGFLPDDVSDPMGDNDSDGLTNEEEYQFGLDPTSGSSVNPITSALDKGTGKFSYTRRNPALSGLSYTYESSTSLSSWDPLTPDLVENDGASPVETITITVPAALLTADALFVRVEGN